MNRDPANLAEMTEEEMEYLLEILETLALGQEGVLPPLSPTLLTGGLRTLRLRRDCTQSTISLPTGPLPERLQSATGFTAWGLRTVWGVEALGLVFIWRRRDVVGCFRTSLWARVMQWT